MTNTYLLEVVKALKPEERQEMVLFLASPLFNKGSNAQELSHLYQIILDAAPAFSEDLLEKERVYAQIFLDQKMVSGKLEKLMADLNKLLRAYALTQRYFSEYREEDQQVDWAKWLRERGLSERSRQMINKLKKQEAQDSAASLERYRTSVWIAEEDHLWELNHNQAKGDLSIPTLIYQLDLYFYNYRTELANRYLLQQKLTQLPVADFFEKGVDVYRNDSIHLQISQKIYNLLKEDLPPEREIQGLILLLNNHENNLSSLSLDHFYAYLRNFCTLLINAGNSEFIPLLHQINKDNLNREFFLLFGKISPHAFLNLVQIAIRAKEISWAKQFIGAYKTKIIGGDETQFYYRLTMAQCHFAEENFEEALIYLPDAPSNSHHHHMVRRLELKIYYEQGSDLLLYKLDAFRKFIERTAPKTLAANLREMDLNFLNILLQLSQSPPKDKARSERLIKRIKDKKLLADGAWLLEKAKELG